MTTTVLAHSLKTAYFDIKYSLGINNRIIQAVPFPRFKVCRFIEWIPEKLSSKNRV